MGRAISSAGTCAILESYQYCRVGLNCAGGAPDADDTGEDGTGGEEGILKQTGLRNNNKKLYAVMGANWMTTKTRQRLKLFSAYKLRYIIVARK